MPWQEVCVQEQRIRFIHDWQKQGDSMAIPSESVCTISGLRNWAVRAPTESTT